MQGLSRVLAGVDLALQLGYRPLKINTVLMKGKHNLLLTNDSFYFGIRNAIIMIMINRNFPTDNVTQQRIRL